ncbi:AraC family transcriptional regulator [Wukongibacter baidiensis]|uniref:helix-turn-helix transcriptional regulator n=1 Tax=Wukongibacter baidiensis TaxID=1723361 RepID=UPI003D7F45E4
MKIDDKVLLMIRNLVGEINENDLKYVDYYVTENFGIFIPTVGFCECAIRPQHTHPSYSFAMFFSEDQSIFPVEIEMKPNHYLAVAISPEVTHEEERTDMFTRYIAIFISTEYYEKQHAVYNNRRPDEYLLNQFLIEQDIMLYIKKYISEYENNIPGRESLLEAFVLIISNYIIRSILDVSNKGDITSERFEIEEIVGYMHQHFGKKLSNLELAKAINMSESHFIRIFKKETGMTPMQYLTNVRIEKAKKLLKIDRKNITEISLICGFNSTSHFSSSFTKYVGMTPSNYRNIYL